MLVPGFPEEEEGRSLPGSLGVKSGAAHIDAEAATDTGAVEEERIAAAVEVAVLFIARVSIRGLSCRNGFSNRP